MGFLKNFLSSQESKINKDWKTLDTLEQLEDILKASEKKPIAIFKHSTRCGISSMAKTQLEENWDIDPESLDFYYLDLITYRPISNKIAELLGVMHQSPQVILIKNGKAVYQSTHHSINVKDLKVAL